MILEVTKFLQSKHMGEVIKRTEILPKMDRKGLFT